MMIQLPLDEMSVEEKLQIMEALWDDLCGREGGIPTPEWHGRVLAERAAARARGDEIPEDFEIVKERLLRELP